MIWFKLSNIIDIFEKQNRRILRKKILYFSLIFKLIFIYMYDWDRMPYKKKSNFLFEEKKIFYKLKK